MQSPRSSRWRIWIGAKSWAFLLPVIGVLVVFVGHDHYRTSVHLRDPSIDLCIADTASAKCPKESLTVATRDPGSSTEVAVLDVSGRLQLSTAMDLFIATFAILLFSSLLIVARCRKPRLDYAQMLLITVLVGVIVYILNGYDTRQFSLLLNSFDVLVRQTLPKTQVDMSGADHLVSALAMFSSAVLAVTFAVIIQGLPKFVAPVGNEALEKQFLEDMKMRCAALKATLVAGAAVLAAAVIYLHALQNWALAFVVKPESIRGIADQWSVSQGTYWTLVLAAAYVPCAVVLYRASHFLARAHENGGEQKQTESEWLETNDLSVSVKGQVLQIVMLLAPWLTGGPLPELAKLLSPINS
jgi:hypothetical protein